MLLAYQRAISIVKNPTRKGRLFLTPIERFD